MAASSAVGLLLLLLLFVATTLRRATQSNTRLAFQPRDAFSWLPLRGWTSLDEFGRGSTPNTLHCTPIPLLRCKTHCSCGQQQQRLVKTSTTTSKLRVVCFAVCLQFAVCLLPEGKRTNDWRRSGDSSLRLCLPECDCIARDAAQCNAMQHRLATPTCSTDLPHRLAAPTCRTDLPTPTCLHRLATPTCHTASDSF